MNENLKLNSISYFRRGWNWIELMRFFLGNLFTVIVVVYSRWFFFTDCIYHGLFNMNKLFVQFYRCFGITNNISSDLMNE